VFIGGLLFLVFVSLVGASLWANDLPRPFYVHGIFALAALPLMWAAMLHFLPVLTRSREAPRAVRALPWLAMGLGPLLLAVFAEKLPRHVLLPVALLIGCGALILLGWAGQRSRRALGKPHPGVRWYLAALAGLAVALAAVFGMLLDPARYAAWYGLHLHLNLVGWVGLTVLGTLPVLLPTALQKFDPNATFRLQLALPWAVFGALAIALAAALRQPVLGAFGGLALMAVVGAHWRGWLALYGAPWRWPGPAVSLALGSAFLVLVLALGIAHGAGWLGGARLLPAFAAGFLLPTVLGALAQLLPVWKYPGPDSPARETFRQALACGAGLRGGLCVLAGAGQLLALSPALALAGLAVLWLLLAVVWALRPQSLRPSAGL
jgi:hypothetical protein